MKVSELKGIKNENGAEANKNILFLHRDEELAVVPGDILISGEMKSKVTDVYLMESHNCIVVLNDREEKISNKKLVSFVEKGLIQIGKQ